MVLINVDIYIARSFWLENIKARTFFDNKIALVTSCSVNRFIQKPD